jgi:hypothetical protein
MGFELSSETIARLKARAGDVERRTGTSAMEAGSTGIGDMLAGIPKSNDPAVREYLEGMNSPFAGMISNLATGDGSQAGGLMGALGAMLGGKQVFAMGPGGPIAMGPKSEPREASPPASEAAVAAAEAALGFALPEGLRQFYRDVADGGVGPGDGIFSLHALAAKWREMTEEPAGPRGQKWPANLIPIHGERWDLTCIDRDSGALIYFDPEEIDYGGWKASFKPEAESLDAWLDQWLDKDGA